MKLITKKKKKKKDLYLHARFGVSHDGEKQRQDVLSVGASIGQTQSENDKTTINTLLIL